MRYPFVKIQKKNNDRVIDWISILLCIFTAGAFMLVQVRKDQDYYFYKAALLFIFLGILFACLWMLIPRLRLAGRVRSLSATATGCWARPLSGWQCPMGQWLFFVFLLLTFLEYQAKYPLEIGFSPDKIVINSLLRKTFPWSAFNNVLMKDGLLTLDFKNNRLLQKQVDEEEDGDADEEEFNRVLSLEQLDAARAKGRPDAPRAARTNGQ